MARTLTANMQTQVTADALTPCLLLKGAFDSGDLNLWTGIGSIVYNGDTYVGGGNCISITGVTETTNTQADSVNVTLNAIKSSNISLALNEEYQGRKASVWFACLDAVGALISSPFLLFKGRMDTMTIVDGGQRSTLGMVCENRLIDFRRAKLRFYSDQDQKALYPTDRGMEYVNQLQDKEIIWGRANPPS